MQETLWSLVHPGLVLVCIMVLVTFRFIGLAHLHTLWGCLAFVGLPSGFGLVCLGPCPLGFLFAVLVGLSLGCLHLRCGLGALASRCHGVVCSPLGLSRLLLLMGGLKIALPLLAFGTIVLSLVLLITLRGSVFTDLVMFPNLPSFCLLGMAGRSLIRMLTSLWCKIGWSRCKRPFGLVCILDLLLLGWFGYLPLALVWPWRFVPWGCQVSVGFPLGSSWGCHALVGFPWRFGLRCCGFPR